MFIMTKNEEVKMPSLLVPVAASHCAAESLSSVQLPEVGDVEAD
jgi:hypothetical protein